MPFYAPFYKPMSDQDIQLVISALNSNDGPALNCDLSADIFAYILDIGELEIDDNWSNEEMKLDSDYSGNDFRTHVYPLIGVFRTLIKEEASWVSLMLHVGLQDFTILLSKLRSMFYWTYRKSIMIYLEKMIDDIRMLEEYFIKNDIFSHVA